MTQITSVLAVATVYISLWTLISRQRRVRLRREIKIPTCMQELDPKVQGGLYARGGVIAGFYGNIQSYEFSCNFGT